MGMFKTKTLSKFNDRLFRIARSEGVVIVLLIQLRGSACFFLVATGLSLGYLKSEFYDPSFTAPKQEAARLE